MTSPFLWVRSLAVGLLGPLLVVLHEAAIARWLESVVSSEASSGEVFISELTSWWLAALSFLLVIGQRPPSISRYQDLSPWAACIIKACKMRRY